MTAAPRGRGWEFVGHGFFPDGGHVTAAIQRVINDDAYEVWSRHIGLHSLWVSADPPSGGWHEYHCRAENSRKRSRITGMFIKSDDQW